MITAEVSAKKAWEAFWGEPWNTIKRKERIPPDEQIEGRPKSRLVDTGVDKPVPRQWIEFARAAREALTSQVAAEVAYGATNLLHCPWEHLSQVQQNSVRRAALAARH